VGTEVGQSELVLVLLHGRWFKPRSMTQLAERINLPGVACVTPAAADRSWYPQRFMDPRAVNEPVLSQAIEQVHETLDQLAAEGVAPERTVLGGFSQGACLACEALAQRPRPLGALVVLCGGLMGANEEEIVQPGHGALEGLPVLLTGTEQDDWIPVERVEETSAILTSAGARVEMRIHPPDAHEVHHDEVLAFRRLLQQLRQAGSA
jgi:phospholipase/carboxylesterase